jgi:hypothetical protein
VPRRVAAIYDAAVTSHEAGVLAGYLLVTIGVPVAGLICLIIGLVQRSRSRARTGPYPGPYQATPGFPVNTGYPPGPPTPYPPPYPSYPPGVPPPPRAGKSATALITIGAVLLALGAVGILGNAARFARHQGQQSHTAGQSPRSAGAAEPEIGRCFTEFELQLGSLNGQPDDCADPGATYELAAKGGPSGTCPDGKRDDSIYSRLTNASRTLCLRSTSSKVSAT